MTHDMDFISNNAVRAGKMLKATCEWLVKKIDEMPTIKVAPCEDIISRKAVLDGCNDGKWVAESEVEQWQI